MNRRIPPSVLIILLNLLLSFASCAAEEDRGIHQDDLAIPAENLPEAKIDLWDPEPQGNQMSGVVRAMFQSAAGDFWFGTQSGLFRHDGKSLVNFDIQDGYGDAAIVNAIAEGKNGNVWFGTDWGLTRYDGEYFKTYTKEDGLAGGSVWRLFVDSTGLLWISSYDGLCYFDGKAFTRFEVPPATKKDPTRGVSGPNLVWCFIEDSEGNFWVSTEGDLYRYDGTDLTRIPIMEEESDTFVYGMLEDSQGNFWFGTSQKGLIHYDGETFTNATQRYGLSGVELGGGYEDSQGNIWFASEGVGVYRFDGSSFTSFSESDGLISHGIHCVLEDNQGRIWFGGWAGVSRFDGESMVNVTRDGPW